MGLELAANSRVLSAEEVKNSNAAIGATALTEANYKTVNEIYLSTVAKDVDGFTAQQAQELFEVANQCPLTGGNAVFGARALYYLVDPDQDFDDPALCLQEGLVTKSVKQTDSMELSVIPNPASEQATLVLTEPMTSEGTITIMNALGKVVRQIRLPMDVRRFDFSTSALAPGVYHIVVNSGSDQVGMSRLSIMR